MSNPKSLATSELGDTVARVIDLCVESVKAKQVSWSEGRLMITLKPSGGVKLAGRFRHDDDVDHSSFATSSEFIDLMNELREATQAVEGANIVRLRLRFSPHGVYPEADYFETVAPLGTTRWVWPDEPGYDGRALEPEVNVIQQSPHWRYQTASLENVSAPRESLGRIRAWLDDNAGDVAAKLNPPASREQIQAVEQSLNVRFPPSLRDAYLVHNGQRGLASSLPLFHVMGWRSLEELAEASDVLKRMARDDVATMIPVLSIDGGHVYVRSVENAAVESEVVEWAAGEDQDFLRADSFGAFLEQFADDFVAGKYAFHDGYLQERSELGEIDDFHPEEV